MKPRGQKLENLKRDKGRDAKLTLALKNKL